jgi:hypothetical protein
VDQSFELPAPNEDFEEFKGALVELVRAEGVELLVPTGEEIFHVSRARDALTPYCEVLAAPWEQMRRLHSKWEFIETLRGRGVRVPETWLIHSRHELATLMAALPKGDRLVLKPVFSRYGAHVAFTTAGERAPAIDASVERPWVAQRFIAGKGRCTWSVAREGRLTAHSAYAANFTAGTGTSIHFEPLDHPRLLDWVRDFAEVEHFTGQLAFDFIETPDGTLYPLECNPRATSGIHLFSPEDRLDEAFFGTSPSLKLPRPNASSMLGLAMLVYGLPEAKTPQRLGEWLTAVVKSRDAVFRWDVPLPFFHQFAVFGHYVAASAARGISVLEASTHDIEWNGEEPPHGR